MAGIRVPSYLAGTARRDVGVRGWIAELPATNAVGAELVLKIGYKFPSAEERRGSP